MEEIIIFLVIAGLSMAFGNKEQNKKKTKTVSTKTESNEYKYLGEPRRKQKTSFKTREDVANEMMKSMNEKTSEPNKKNRETVIKDMMKAFGVEEILKGEVKGESPYQMPREDTKRAQELKHDHAAFVETARETANRKIREATMEAEKLEAERKQSPASLLDELAVIKLSDLLESEDMDIGSNKKRNKSLKNIRTGIIYSEILNKPVSMRK